MKLEFCTRALCLALFAGSSAFLVPPDVNFEDIRGLRALKWISGLATPKDRHRGELIFDHREAAGHGWKSLGLPCPGCPMPKLLENGEIQLVKDVENMIHLNFTHSDSVVKLNDVPIFEEYDFPISLWKRSIPVRQSPVFPKTWDDMEYQVSKKDFLTLGWRLERTQSDLLCEDSKDWRIYGLQGVTSSVIPDSYYDQGPGTYRYAIVFIQRWDPIKTMEQPNIIAVKHYDTTMSREELNSHVKHEIRNLVNTHASSICSQGEGNLNLTHPETPGNYNDVSGHVECPSGLIGLGCRLRATLNTLAHGGSSLFSRPHMRPAHPSHKRPSCPGMRKPFFNTPHIKGGADKFRRPGSPHWPTTASHGQFRHPYWPEHMHHPKQTLSQVLHDVFFNYFVPVVLGIFTGILAIVAGLGAGVALVAIFQFFRFFLLHLYLGKDEFERRYLNKVEVSEESEGLIPVTEKESEALLDTVEAGEAPPAYAEE